MKHVSIIGAGIGGLTLGIALKQKGFSVKVYEAASEIKTVGAGIILGCNAMQVYQKLALDSKLAEKGNMIDRMSITDQNLKNLSVLALDYFVDKYKIANYAIHRADLHQILLDEFDATEIVFGKRLVSLDQTSKSLNFEDGSSEEYEIAIGADGIHSKVRTSLFGDKFKIRNAGQVCWRGVIDYQLPEEFRSHFREAWGLGTRVGHGQINESQVYWFALVNSKEGLETFEGDVWKKDFQSFDPMLQELINNTNSNKIHIGYMTELEIMPKWYLNDVCLIGDAAHAMTPNMGQGAGQSIEDAFALANMMFQYSGNNTKTFEAFQSYRKKKVDKIVKNSWRIGPIAQMESAFWSGFRNGVMRITPAFLAKQSLKEAFKI